MSDKTIPEQVSSPAWVWEADEHCEREYPQLMEFRLVYHGPLLASTRSDGRVKHKHKLRQHFHRQLVTLWHDRFPMNRFRSEFRTEQSAETGETRKWTHVDELINQYRRAHFPFVPLITKDNGLLCSLDILFLRLGAPGQIIGHGGDIDNRLKTLLDALSIPQAEAIRDVPVEKNENPFHVLLEDDALITDIHVTTDQLLDTEFGGYDPEVRDMMAQDTGGTHDQFNVHLVISAKTLVADPVKAERSGMLWS